MENVWGMLVRLVYKDGSTYDTVDLLKNVILKCWDEIDSSFIQAIRRRRIAIVERKGA